MRRFAYALLILAACGTDEGGGNTPVDASPDAAVVPVVGLSSCPADVAATVTDSASAFIPKASTIAVGEVVKFVITPEHFVLPNTLTTTDDALRVSRGETKCFRFAAAG